MTPYFSYDLRTSVTMSSTTYAENNATQGETKEYPHASVNLSIPPVIFNREVSAAPSMLDDYSAKTAALFNPLYAIYPVQTVFHRRSRHRIPTESRE